MKETSSNSRWFALDRDSIKVTEVGEDKALFRIVPFDVLLQMLSEKVITLVNTYRWDDIYENFILNYHFFKDGKRVPVYRLENRFYGQCWSVVNTGLKLDDALSFSSNNVLSQPIVVESSFMDINLRLASSPQKSKKNNKLVVVIRYTNL